MGRLFSIFFFFISCISYADSLDSLLNVIQAEKDDTARFSLFTKQIKRQLHVDPKVSQELASKQLEEAKTDRQKAKAFLNLGLAYDFQYVFDDAIKNYQKSLQLHGAIKDTVGMARTYLNLGIVNYYKGDLDSSIYHYIQCLNLSDQIGQKRLCSSALANLGAIHKDLNEHEQSLKYHKKSLEIDIELKDTVGIASSYNSMGIAYRGLNDYDKAIEYYTKSLEIRKGRHDDPGIAMVLTNIGQLHFAKKEFATALEFNLKAVKMEEERNNELGMSESYVNIGDCYYELGEYPLAKEYLEKSLVLAKKLEVADVVVAGLEGLSNTYAKLGMYELAYRTNQEYAVLQDSLFHEKRMKSFMELESKYHTERAEKENELLKKENVINQLQLSEKDALERNLYLGLGLLLVIIASIGYAFRNNKIASKKLAQRNHRIELMNTELQSKNKSITDSIVYAKRIQEAILPQDKLVKQYFENSFILYKPKDIVSGDFYWMHTYQNGSQEQVLFAAVDCTGHGVPGAFMSIVGNNGLSKAVKEQGITDTALILDALNEHVIGAIQQQKSNIKDGMDLALCNLNLETNELQFSGAHNPLYLIRENELTIYPGDKQAIGDARRQFTAQKLQLQKGDVCYMFTDGYVDQFGGPRNKKFNARRFKETLMEIHTYQLEYQREELERIFAEWKGSEEQLDDICVIGFKI